MNARIEVFFHSVGFVRTQASDEEIRNKRQEYEATMEMPTEFQEALESLDGFSHTFVLSYLHKLRPEQIGPLKASSRRFLRRGFRLGQLPFVGLFALGSPTRPNSIGLSLAKLIRIEGKSLIVPDLACFDGTRVLDIKPYRNGTNTRSITTRFRSGTENSAKRWKKCLRNPNPETIESLQIAVPQV